MAPAAAARGVGGWVVTLWEKGLASAMGKRRRRKVGSSVDNISMCFLIRPVRVARMSGGFQRIGTALSETRAHHRRPGCVFIYKSLVPYPSCHGHLTDIFHSPSTVSPDVCKMLAISQAFKRKKLANSPAKLGSKPHFISLNEAPN